MTTSDAPRPSSRTAIVVAAVLAVALLAGGAWLVWRGTATASFGWFAYAPLSETVYWPGPSTADWVGIGMLVVGLLGLGGIGGYALGRRR